MSESSESNYSIIPDIPVIEWNMQEAVAYEVTVDMISTAVGCYSELMGIEKKRPTPDAKAIARWRQAQSQCSSERRSLDSTDMATIEEASNRYAKLIKELMELAKQAREDLGSGVGK